MRLVAGPSAINLKLSRIDPGGFVVLAVFKGWYVSIKRILLLYSSVELLLVRASLERGVLFSRGHDHVSEFFCAVATSLKERGHLLGFV